MTDSMNGFVDVRLISGLTHSASDKLVDGELIDAAACYLYSDDYAERLIAWPFSKADWRPSYRRSNLIRAAAFIIEEIDRLDRERIR